MNEHEYDDVNVYQVLCVDFASGGLTLALLVTVVDWSIKKISVSLLPSPWLSSRPCCSASVCGTTRQLFSSSLPLLYQNNEPLNSSPVDHTSSLPAHSRSWRPFAPPALHSPQFKRLAFSPHLYWTSAHFLVFTSRLFSFSCLFFSILQQHATTMKKKITFLLLSSFFFPSWFGLLPALFLHSLQLEPCSFLHLLILLQHVTDFSLFASFLNSSFFIYPCCWAMNLCCFAKYYSYLQCCSCRPHINNLPVKERFVVLRTAAVLWVMIPSLLQNRRSRC